MHIHKHCRRPTMLLLKCNAPVAQDLLPPNPLSRRDTIAQTRPHDEQLKWARVLYILLVHSTLVSLHNHRRWSGAMWDSTRTPTMSVSSWMMTVALVKANKRHGKPNELCTHLHIPSGPGSAPATLAQSPKHGTTILAATLILPQS